MPKMLKMTKRVAIVIVKHSLCFPTTKDENKKTDLSQGPDREDKTSVKFCHWLRK